MTNGQATVADARHLSPLMRRRIKSPAHDPYPTREAERDAFVALRDLRLAAWTAVLSDPDRAATVLTATTDPEEVLEHPTLTAWHAQRKAGGADLAEAAYDLASHLRATDVDDRRLHKAARLVASFVMPGVPGAKSADAIRWTGEVTTAVARVTAQVAAIEARNLRLLVAMAIRFGERCSGVSLELDDLIAHGYGGLRTAVLRFDVDRGFRFSTYAGHWLRHAITRAMQDHGRTIRVPVHSADVLCKIATASRTIGPGATSEAIAEVVGVSAARVARLRRESATTLLPPASLEAPVQWRGDATALTLGDTLRDDAVEPADDVVARVEAEDALTRLLGGLTERERMIVERRFGVGAGAGQEATPKNATAHLTSIGQDIGISRERVRQICGEALGKMRRAARSSGMASAAG